MKNKLFTKLVLCGVSTIASADAYWGIGFGKVDYEYDFNKSTGLEIYLGNRFNDNFAMELGFIDTGETEDDFYDDTLSGETISITAKLIAPVSDDFELQLAFGMHQWELEITEYDFFGDEKYTVDDRDLFYGIGVNYEISSSLKAGINHRIYEIDEDEISFTSLNFEFEF